MVRALLDGRKTQTRRAMKPQPGEPWRRFHLEGGCQRADWTLRYHQGAAYWSSAFHADAPGEPASWRCPYGAPGDRLWVRETFSGWHHHEHQPPSEWSEGGSIWYWADGDPTEGDWTRPRPSIHMPRWASRLTLQITEVRVERLQDISEADALAEGAEACEHGFWFDRTPALAGSTAIGAYYCLWEQINGAGSWAANPWVWALTFARVKPPPDIPDATDDADAHTQLIRE